MCIYIYIYIHIIHASINIDIYIYIHIYTYICLHLYIYVHTPAGRCESGGGQHLKQVKGRRSLFEFLGQNGSPGIRLVSQRAKKSGMGKLARELRDAGPHRFGGRPAYFEDCFQRANDRPNVTTFVKASSFEQGTARGHLGEHSPG